MYIAMAVCCSNHCCYIVGRTSTGFFYIKNKSYSKHFLLRYHTKLWGHFHYGSPFLGNKNFNSRPASRVYFVRNVGNCRNRRSWFCFVIRCIEAFSLWCEIRSYKVWMSIPEDYRYFANVFLPALHIWPWSSCIANENL